MKKKLLVLCLAVVLVFSLLTACSMSPSNSGEVSDSTPETEEGTDAPKVTGESTEKVYRVICMFRLGDNFGAWLKAAFEAEAAKYDNIDLVVLDDEMSADVWMKQMENAITDGYDYAISQVPMCDGSEICQQAKDKGMKLIGVNIFQDWMPAYMPAVVVSDYELGASIAKAAAERLPENANIVILNGEAGIPPTLERRQAFQELLLDARSDITLLDEQTADFQKDQAMKKTDDWLQVFDKIDGVIAASDSMALGAMESFSSNGKDLSTVQFYGLDGLADACQAILNGQMEASGCQDANEYARIAMDLVLKDIAGEMDLGAQKAGGNDNGYEDKYVFDVVLVDKENAQKQLDYLESIGAVK